MNISELCIRRPVMTVLLTAALILSGALAYKYLPVAALPRVDFPVISVSASLPGASPDTMASSVAIQLEREFSTIAGIESITSSSVQGSTNVNIQFELDRDIDSAALDVQAALSRVQRRLPIEMTTPPSYRKVNPADQPVLLLALSSATLPLSQVDEYAETLLSPALSTLSGVAQVQVWGAQKFAVRIRLNPEALTARGIGVDEVQNAIVAANSSSPVGVVSGSAQQLILETNTQLFDAQSFSHLVIATRNGAPVRLGDVASVIDGVENDRTASWFNGTRTIVLAIQRQPDANTVEVVDAVKRVIPTFKASLPPSIDISVLIDRSLSIRAAVEDVQFTLILTIGLVVMVIFLFLRKVSATLIPGIAVPISLIGAVGAMKAFGFSIDNISLLALTLSVGLVVDDAIVMLENIVRYIEEGTSPFEAAVKGSREIGFTIVSITLSLVAVFIPIFMMGGVVGRLFHEFAVTVTLAIAASAITSLTLTPMLCSRFINHDHHAKPNRFERVTEAGFQAWLRGYDRTLTWCLAHRRVVVAVFFATLVGTVVLFQQVQKGFFPTEDNGQIFAQTEARQDISFDAMIALQQQVAAAVAKNPYVETFISSVGGGGNVTNAGRVFMSLKDRAHRPKMEAVLQSLRRDVADIPGINVFFQPVQNLNVSGRQSKSLYQYTLQGLDQPQLYQWSDRLMQKMAQMPQLQDVTSDLQLSGQNASIHIDLDKAYMLGLTAENLRSSLYSAFGTRQISTIYTPTNDYEVILELSPEAQKSADVLNRIYIRSDSGKLIPLGAVARIDRASGPISVNHQGQLPAVTLSFNLTPSVSLGAAVTAIEGVQRDIGMPDSITGSFQGTAQVFQQALANQGLLLLTAVLVIYVVLGVLYESFIHPLTILSGLPSAAVGAVGSLMLFGFDLSVIAIIGVLMLIGIVKKNAIMMIDFALEARRDGATPQDAIYRACLLRFRPIMMTTMAALMGTLPIALASGASAELRQPLGVAVVGGLVVSQLLTLYITPVLYLYMEDFSHWIDRQLHRGKARRAARRLVPANTDGRANAAE
ncbi:putative RND efflux transporter precursor [Nitrospirillum viridazoti Y2]|uniref:HAE1 family hydrophobic/amphiphilic exporter-1 n=1 Tax=Nitrospirillum amazonense TaxID=28077 RepID=A0A560HQG7_9PROT|nr:efflux RND transporter permease subunit [Nitrospirillum amazonense]EGY02738.1 putative RND efflux transporter precursor [Nitrospirillum amazonense Y2]TWB48808.1 HAE1 family hydrophobic/amphiphilic exporter-1 [Nitrospirillum amazonense]